MESDGSLAPPPPLTRQGCILDKRRGGVQHISLGDGGDYANTERFQGSVPLLLRLCPLSVPEGGGGGMWGTFGKPSKRAIWNTPGLHAVLTTCLRFWSIWTTCKPLF